MLIYLSMPSSIYYCISILGFNGKEKSIPWHQGGTLHSRPALGLLPWRGQHQTKPLGDRAKSKAPHMLSDHRQKEGHHPNRRNGKPASILANRSDCHLCHLGSPPHSRVMSKRDPLWYPIIETSLLPDNDQFRAFSWEEVRLNWTVF